MRTFKDTRLLNVKEGIEFGYIKPTIIYTSDTENEISSDLLTLFGKLVIILEDTVITNIVFGIEKF